MKGKWMKMMTAGAVFSVLFAEAAFARVWLKGEGVNQDKWWYANEDGTWANSGWFWIDGNNDGIAENYYFDAQGWMYANTTTPDGYVVNENGAMVLDGQVAIQVVQALETAPAVDAAADSINRVYNHTKTYRDVNTGEVWPCMAMLPDNVTITAVDGNTIHLVFWGKEHFTTLYTGTFVLKKNGDIYEFDSYLGSETIDDHNRYADIMRFDGNKVEVSWFNWAVGRITMYEIYER